jgi:geranylgeranyl pyrophosphate synthase
VQDEHRIPLRARLDDFLRHHAVASKKLAGGRVVRVDGGPIPFFVASRLTTHSTLLLGDAGGFGNAIHGGGIYQARKSAALAAPHARDFLESGSPAALESYAEEAHAHFREYEGRWDVRMRPFFWEDALVNTTVRRAAGGERPLVEAMGIILNGDRSHEVAYRLLEPRMLDLIHDCLRERTRRYRAMVDEALTGLFQGARALDVAIRHVLLADAKRVRASLALVATEAAGGQAEAALPMAVAFELLHTASLIHDDIMDEAHVRRGRPCVHRAFGTAIAITAGDALIFEAYRQLLSLSSAYAREQLETVLRIFSSCAAETCRGQSEDVTFPVDGGTLRQYLRMVRRKTGSMIEAPLEGGAVLGGMDSAACQRMRKFGRALGTAFQIVDDALDYLGSEAKVRKSLGNDLRHRRGSAMLIFCRARCTARERAAMERAIAAFTVSRDPGDLTPVLDLFQRHDAVAFTQRLCGRYIDRARRLIAGIGGEPARSDLESIATMVGYWGLLAARLPEDGVSAGSRAATRQPPGRVSSREPPGSHQWPAAFRWSTPCVTP